MEMTSIIPEGWQELSLFDIADRQKARFDDGDWVEAQHITNKGVRLIQTGNIGVGSYIEKDAKKYIYEASFVSLKCKPLEMGDLLICRLAEPAGRACILPDIGDARVITSVDVSIFRPDPQRFDRGYLVQYLSTPQWFESVLENVGGTTHKRISRSALGKIKVPIPIDKSEQSAIATALDDVDTLLAAQDALIAKKRAIKQGAMQELLTGKRRLPGFSGEWEVRRLGEAGEISSAGVDKKVRQGEIPVRLVNYLDAYHKDFIFSHDLNHWVTAHARQLLRCAVKKGDVFFTPTSETRDDIGHSAVAMEDIQDAAYSYHVVRLRLHEPWDLRFRAYAFKTREFLDQAERLCDGNGTRYVISQGKFRSMTVSVPPVPEQAAIANVLADMDSEITTLESQRSKTAEIKQGMMQVLLTGQIRLI